MNLLPRIGLLRERERETDRQTDMDQWPPTCVLTRDQPCILNMCPDWELNPQPFGVWKDAATN